MAMRKPPEPAKRGTGPMQGRSGSTGQYDIVGPRGRGAGVERTVRGSDPLSPSPLPQTRIKKAGGSLMVTVPASARDALHLAEGQMLNVSVDGSRLVFEPAKPAAPKYTLDELLAQCDFDVSYSDEERAWIDAPPVGREIL